MKIVSAILNSFIVPGGPEPWTTTVAKPFDFQAFRQIVDQRGLEKSPWFLRYRDDLSRIEDLLIGPVRINEFRRHLVVNRVMGKYLWFCHTGFEMEMSDGTSGSKDPYFVEGHERFFIGTADDALVKLHSAAVAPHQVEIVCRDERYFIRAIDSGKSVSLGRSGSEGGNVVFVPLSPDQEMPLHDTDIIRFGNFNLKFHHDFSYRFMRLGEQIARINSFQDLYELMKHYGMEEYVIRYFEFEKIGSTHNLYHSILHVTNDNGYQEALWKIFLTHEFRNFRRYFPCRPSELLINRLRSVAEKIREAETENILEILRSSEISELVPIASDIEDYLAFDGSKCLKDIPSFLGLREKIRANLSRQLSLNDSEINQLRGYRVDPLICFERPWRSQKVPPRLGAIFDYFQPVVQERLAHPQTQGMEIQFMGDDAEILSEDRHGTSDRMYDNYTGLDASGFVREALREDERNKFIAFIEESKRQITKKGIRFIDGGSWVLSKNRNKSGKSQGRIYLALNQEHFVAIWKALNDLFNMKGVFFKIAAHLEGYWRNDSGVIYFSKEAQQDLVYRAILNLSRQHPEFFRLGQPFFTTPVFDAEVRPLAGISFGESPPYSEISFGQHRSYLMTLGLRIIRYTRRAGISIEWDEMRQVFAWLFASQGVDLYNPALYEGARERFAEFLAHTPCDVNV